MLRTLRQVHKAHLVQAGGWRDLQTPWIRRVFLIGLGLAVVQQTTGVNSIIYNGAKSLANRVSIPRAR